MKVQNDLLQDKLLSMRSQLAAAEDQLVMIKKQEVRIIHSIPLKSSGSRGSIALMQTMRRHC